MRRTSILLNLDRYEEAVVVMIKSKQAGMPQAAAKAAVGKSNVIDLMDELSRSLGTSLKAASTQNAKKPRKRVAGQNEMLPPISGKAAPEEATKKQVANVKPSKASNHRKPG